MIWFDLNAEQRRVTLHAMTRFGGRFVSRLADAWVCADDEHARCLGTAFPALLERYGPGSQAYADAEAREGA